jgi:demethylmenaquinone methyltransferase/2-methoxy-6-polyprenyl-1,4-benzoquinol methylase
MFERLAPDYDRLNSLLTFGLDRSWRRALVESVGLGPGQRVLDVGAGTGRSLAEARRAVGPAGLAVGVDFTEAMLRRARGHRVLANALRLPFPAGAFDASVSAFALRDVADQRVMLEEMGRVIRPRGRLGILEIGQPAGPLRRAGFEAWFRGAVPRIASVFGQGESHRFLVRSVAYLPSPANLEAMLAGAGIRDVRRKELTLGAAQLVWGIRA